jgi:SAM-dependent MidA family methyltransferase
MTAADARPGVHGVSGGSDFLEQWLFRCHFPVFAFRVHRFHPMSQTFPPPLDDASRAHAKAMATHLRAAIAQAGGWLSFEHWMAEALYAPGLGYYAAGSAKLAEPAMRVEPAGDFVTAPELTPLFGQVLAAQVAQVLEQTGTHDVLEFGAGTGALAEQVIRALDANGVQVHYRIVEVSADLRARQQARLAPYAGRIEWLDRLPDAFEGCVLANEVLDAMPVQVFRWDEADALLERGVVTDGEGGFTWSDKPAPPRLTQLVSERMPPLADYVSETNLQGEAWVRGMGQWLRRGTALLIDYGFPRREYYHPQRTAGTLMCHLRHRSHADPFLAPGLQDITAHVDFTAMADAALAGGLNVLGYTSQARFLMNAGLMDHVTAVDANDAANYARLIAPVQKLLSEAEMGELFKVLAVGRGIEPPLLGFRRGDRRGTL